MCGTELDDMSLDASLSKQIFAFDGLKWYENLSGQADRYDACTYTILSRPEGLYPSGSIELKISKINNVEIFLNGGKSREDAKIVVVEENASVKEADPSKVYSVPIQNSLFVTVLPIKNEIETSFEFEYQITGTPQPGFIEEFYIKHFTGPDGFRTLIVFGACIGCLLLLFCACVCICIQQCRKRKDDDDIEDKNKVHTIKQDIEPMAVNPHAEMKLESMSERGSDIKAEDFGVEMGTQELE